jgi:hypothetical protein
MSAFMCGDDLFAEVGKFLAVERPDLLGEKFAHLGLTPQQFVTLLRQFNVQSLRECYPRDRDWSPSEAYIDLDAAALVSPAQARKHLACIGYQSCETGLWKALAGIVEAMEIAIFPMPEHDAARGKSWSEQFAAKPAKEYDEAKWGSAAFP